MFTSTNLNPSLLAQLDILNDFKFKIAHVKGMHNGLPDSLSRLYPPIPEDQALEGEQDKQIKKLRKLILTKRADLIHYSKSDKVVHKKKAYSKDPDLKINDCTILQIISDGNDNSKVRYCDICSLRKIQ